MPAPAASWCRPCCRRKPWSAPELTAAQHARVATICHVAAYRRSNRDQEHAMTTTSGSAKWQGGIKDGKGAISTKSGALNDYPYGFASRFEGKPGSNPEELAARRTLRVSRWRCR